MRRQNIGSYARAANKYSLRHKTHVKYHYLLDRIYIYAAEILRKYALRASSTLCRKEYLFAAKNIYRTLQRRIEQTSNQQREYICIDDRAPMTNRDVGDGHFLPAGAPSICISLCDVYQHKLSICLSGSLIEDCSVGVL